MNRRQLLSAGLAAGMTGLSGCTAVSNFAKDTYRKVTNSALPEPIPETSPEEKARRMRYTDETSPLNKNVKEHWEYASNSSGNFIPHTAQIRDGTLYTGFLEDTGEPAYLKSGALHAINAKNGSKKWSTNAVVHDIAVPDGDHLYMCSSIAASEPPNRLQRITKVDKETGETGEMIYQEKSSRKFNGTLIEGDVLVTSQHDHLLVLSLSNNERIWSKAGVNGYAVNNGTIYVVSDGLKAYNLETGDIKWSWLDASNSPRDPDFGQPRIQDDLILVRDQNDNTVYVYDSSGSVNRQYVIRDNLAKAPIFSLNTVFAPYRTEDTFAGKAAGVIKYSVTENGELQEDWEYSDSVMSLHHAFENGVVMSDTGLVDKEGATALAIPVPGFASDEGRNRFMNPKTVRGYDIGLVFNNAVFTFGNTIRAYAPA